MTNRLTSEIATPPGEEPAPEDAPALAAEVERLRAELATMRDQYVEAVAVVAELAQRYGRRQHEHNADRERWEGLHAELAARPTRAEVLHAAMQALYPAGIHSPAIGPQEAREVAASLTRGED